MIELLDNLGGGFMNNNEAVTQFLRTAVNIDAFNDEEEKIHNGTGFFYKIKLGSGENYGKHVHICLVSNRHVLEGVSSLSIYENLNAFSDEESPEFSKYTVRNVKDRVIVHESQDLAIINISDLILRWMAQEVDHTFKFLDNDRIAFENDLDIINADILMVGFPMSLQSNLSFKGIIYRGRLAYPPNIKFSQDDNYLLNMDGYPGNSGSPVFSIQYSTGDIRLIGVQCSIYNPVVGYYGTEEFRQNISLTNAVKVKYLKELEPLVDQQWKKDFTPENLSKLAEQAYDKDI